jgi:hypothetical protein
MRGKKYRWGEEDYPRVGGRTFGEHSGNRRTTEHSGNIHGTFSEHSGNIEGTLREHSRNIQGTFRVKNYIVRRQDATQGGRGNRSPVAMRSEKLFDGETDIAIDVKFVPRR